MYVIYRAFRGGRQAWFPNTGMFQSGPFVHSEIGYRSCVIAICVAHVLRERLGGTLYINEIELGRLNHPSTLWTPSQEQNRRAP